MISSQFVFSIKTSLFRGRMLHKEQNLRRLFSSHSATNHKAIKPTAFDYSATIACKFVNEAPIEVHAIWLRHHCQCSKCYNYSTNQRTQIPSDLPESSLVANVSATNNDLIVSWKDGHVSKYNKDWLIKFTPQTFKRPNNFSVKAKLITNFEDDKQLPLDILFSQSKSVKEERNPLNTAISYEEFMKEGNGVAKLLSSIIQHGFGIVNECPPDFETTKQVIRKVSHPQSTIYGDFSEWTSDLAHADTAYTSDIVHLHNDTTYFTEPIGLQIFHCLKHEGTGGMNWLVDGFHLAQNIAETHPEIYKTFSRVNIPCQYIDTGSHHFLSNDVTFGHDWISGRLQKIRYNPHDMAILSGLQQEEVAQFYESLVYFSNLLESNPIPIKFTPGLIIFLDNWRLLHGREAFTGFRHLCGAYISRSDWLSKARTLKLIDYN